MEAKKYRYGNLVEFEGIGIREIWGIDAQGVTNISSEFRKYNAIKPIPLTEEWFLKIKTHKIDENKDVYIPHPECHNQRFYLIPTDSGFFIQRTSGYYCPLQNYNHITQLYEFQNFYRWETGEELEIKL